METLSAWGLGRGSFTLLVIQTTSNTSYRAIIITTVGNLLSNEVVKQVFGNGLITSEGEVCADDGGWRSLRFTVGRLRILRQPMVDETTAMLERWARVQQADKTP